MALIQLNKDKPVSYVPISQRGVEDPLTVWIKYVPAVLHDEYFSRLQIEVGNIASEEKKAQASAAHDKAMFLGQVTKVENFLDDDGNQINDVGVFYDSIDITLRKEIITVMVSHSLLTKGQRKNLLGGSDTLSKNQKAPLLSTAKSATKGKKGTVKTKKD